LDIKIRYTHKNPLTKTKIKISEINPKINKDSVSIQINEVWVIG
jgi:hypothetical protein